MSSTAGTIPSTLDEAGLAVLRVMQARNPKARPHELIPDVHPSRIPRHVAIIMDGNGRWAKSQGLPRMLGHREGAKTVQAIVEAAGRLGIEVLTLYSFSLDNWKRPQEEVAALMALYLEYMALERQTLARENIRFRQIGRREGMPAQVLAEVDKLEADTRGNTSGTLCLAVNYGSRAEITDAARAIARDVASGKLRPEDVDEKAVASRMYAPELPDPDLLIRTAGEMRVSNYLLWQISYAELFVTPTLWPEFSVEQFHDAIRDYSKRSRRFGGLEKA